MVANQLTNRPTILLTPVLQVLASMVDSQTYVGTEFQFYIPSLILLFIVGYAFMVITYGTAAPTGLFIPSLVVGAAGGRLVGRVVR